MWPPVMRDSTRSAARGSPAASWGSWSRRRRLRSAGPWMAASRDMGHGQESGQARHNILRQCLRARAAEAIPRRAPRCATGRARRQAARASARAALDAQQLHVGRLGERRVPAGGLAQLVAGGGGVEHVVGDLEGEPDVLRRSRCSASTAGRRRLGRQRRRARRRPGSARRSCPGAPRSARAGRAAGASASRSSHWPPTIPSIPPASNSSRAIRPSGRRRQAELVAPPRRAPAPRPAPAGSRPASRWERRMRRCVVGRPRRRSSSSMQGRSSCTSE